MAELVAAHVDLDAVVRVAEPLPPGPAWNAADAARARETSPGRCSPPTAVFGGPAFTFGYAEHVELLAAAGAEVVVVDPLRDEALPDGTAALVLPGGFPEEHVAALGANAPLLAAVRDLAASGAPVHAECGGLLYLCDSLDGAPMCGVLPATAAMTGRLTLGYREAVALADSPLFPAGARAAGHEFHHCAVTPRAGTAPAWGWRGGGPEGFVAAGVHASFLHTHPAGAPEAVARFVARARGTAEAPDRH
jgi:cobyrinic acid a,c-diamide synthase